MRIPPILHVPNFSGKVATRFRKRGTSLYRVSGRWRKEFETVLVDAEAAWAAYFFIFLLTLLFLPISAHNFEENRTHHRIKATAEREVEAFSARQSRHTPTQNRVHVLTPAADSTFAISTIIIADIIIYAK